MDTPGATTDPNRVQARRLFSGWRLAALIIGASAVLGVTDFFQPMTGESDHEAAREALSGPDLTITHAVITSFRKTGELRYRLSAPRIEQFSPLDRIYLRDPDLTISSEPDPPWRVSAERGIVRNASTRGKQEEVLLEENVRMEQDFADGRNYLLVTPSITIYPERQYAETMQDVMITTHAGRTHAVGLEGNLDQGLLKLFSDDEQRVHTIILVDQFK